VREAHASGDCRNQTMSLAAWRRLHIAESSNLDCICCAPSQSYNTCHEMDCKRQLMQTEQGETM